MRFSISYDEVKAYVESLPEDTSEVGTVCNSQKCVIAQAILDKYSNRDYPIVWVWVEPGHVGGVNWIRVWTPTYAGNEIEQHNVDMGEDSDRLRDLANGFDRIFGTDRPNKETVLQELF
jgi:hypothetical protein